MLNELADPTFEEIRKAFWTEHCYHLDLMSDLLQKFTFKLNGDEKQDAIAFLHSVGKERMLMNSEELFDKIGWMQWTKDANKLFGETDKLIKKLSHHIYGN